MDDAEKRKRLKVHYAECARVCAQHKRLTAEFDRRLMQDLPAWRGPLPVLVLPSYPQYPDDLRGLKCGARTRAGTPCKRIDIFANGRCKLHGGMSTGPRTKAGKARSALNGLAPKKRTP